MPAKRVYLSMNGEKKFSSHSVFYRKLSTLLVAAVASFSSGIHADDTEVFFGQNTSQANVLFIVDVSGSMGTIDNGETTTRLQRLQSALTELVNTTNDINVGLMSFTGSGNQFPQEIKPITENRADMLASINALTAGGGTPTVGALFEGAQYYRGEPLMGSGQVYPSPIESSCQSNHIVLLTDGSPTQYPATETEIAKVIYGDSTTTCPAASLPGGTCGAELANYLFANDHSTTIADTNNIITHTIGFNFSAPWLATLSEGRGEDGKGKHFNAESASDLITAFDSILEVATDSSNSFAAPAITLDQFTRYSHRDDMYLALFQPNNTQRWAGNLKRYSFDGQVKDKTGTVALDTSTGEFLADAQSYWSKKADGGNVAEGGAAYLFDASKRNVYTYLGASALRVVRASNRHVNNARRNPRTATQQRRRGHPTL